MNVAVLDTNQEYVDYIKGKIEHLQETQGIKIYCDGFTSSDKFLTYFYNKKYDLVLLDTQLSDGNGVDVAEIVHNIKPSSIIIFISEHTEYMNRVFGVKAFQFLTKPLDEAYFYKEMQRAIVEYRHRNKAFVFPTSRGSEIVNLDDIIYIETSYNDYRIHSPKRSYYGSIKMIQQLKKEILEFSFYKIQRSYIVNLKHVAEYDSETVIMSNGDMLNLSRKKYKDFEQHLLRYLDTK